MLTDFLGQPVSAIAQVNNKPSLVMCVRRTYHDVGWPRVDAPVRFGTAIDRRRIRAHANHVRAKITRKQSRAAALEHLVATRE
jgi:hypothetical protein